MTPTASLSLVAIGIGASLLIDAWAFFLRRAFAIPSLDYCLLGRWVLHMPSGTFRHANIRDAAAKRNECVAGWAAHLAIGVTLAALFVAIVSPGWLRHPTPLPALAFGVATVAIPFLTIQPAFGLGIASSRTKSPMAARLKSVGTHAVYGAGLYLFALLLRVVPASP